MCVHQQLKTDTAAPRVESKRRFNTTLPETITGSHTSGTQRRARKRNNSETNLNGNLLWKTSALVPRTASETQIVVAETERKLQNFPESRTQ
jgi:hypothetical protein